MTLCNNNDQTCFSDTLTSARPLRGRQNPQLSESGFNTTLGVQQMLMHRKTCLTPILLFQIVQLPCRIPVTSMYLHALDPGEKLATRSKAVFTGSENSL